VSTLCLPDVTAHDQISQAFSLLQVIKLILEVETAWEHGRLTVYTVFIVIVAGYNFEAKKWSNTKLGMYPHH